MAAGVPDPEVAFGSGPRSARRLLGASFGLYRRYPLLFFALAGGVIVPYTGIVLLFTGDGPLSDSALSFKSEMLLTLVMWCLVTPLVSALHIHAVADVRAGRSPRLLEVAGKGLSVLPVVVAASIISGLGIAAGFFALIVPGIYLSLRWAVVAQAAAIERQGWLPALQSSGRLVSGSYAHVFVFVLFVVVIVSVPSLLVGRVTGGHAADIGSVFLGLILEILTSSFAALATALLYFDLRARREGAADYLPKDGDSLDPPAPDGERPKGWYVDPSDPGRMRYWAGEELGWQGKARTPRQLRRAWAERTAADHES